MTNETQTTIAHWYENGDNMELVQIGDNKYIVKTNGQVQDSRNWIGVAEAAKIWDEAAHQDETRPTWQLTAGNVKTASAEQILSAYETSSYPEGWTIDQDSFGGTGGSGSILGVRITVSEGDNLLRSIEQPK